ncbi:ABC transporter substrate-binding protein [Reyranella sp.]|uniref:ABC transporter substrate-binding protein n=1 Tax=Reyranella sp. TaxID=1929291 RepID=UPI003783FF1A
MIRKALTASLACLLMGQGIASAKDLRIANVGDMRSMIPAGATDPGTQVPQVQIYEGLVTWREDGSVAPMLAADLPTISADGLTYTFKLRDGLTFHDGTAVTAQSVVKTWEWYLNPKNSWVCRSYFDGAGTVKIVGVEAKSATEVEFKLAQPSKVLLTQMARTDCQESAIMAESMVTGGQRPTMPIGTGPFKVTAIRPGQDITLVKFDGYKPRSEKTDGFAGRKEALVDKIVFVIIPDPAAANAALLAGNIDLWPRIELNYAKALESTPGLKVDSAITPSIYTLAFQTAKGPLQNATLRQAINYAIDRKGMIAALTDSRATASSSIIPASTQFYAPATRGGDFAYNPEKAAALLKQSGYKGEPVRITTNKNYPMMYETGVMVQGYLQAIGVNATLEVNDFATQFSKYNTGNYDMMTWNYNPSFVPALVFDRFTGSKETQASKLWTDPEARKLTDELLQTPVDRQQPFYTKLQQLYVKEAPMIVWATGEVTSAYRDAVQGYAAWPGRLPRLWNVSVK